MKPRRLSVFVLWIVIISGCLVLPVSAQRMPREDVVDVSAIGEGLCVSNLFQANMVLQRDKPIHVWGWAAPGEEVTVAFAGGRGSVRTGDDRAWKVTLPAVPANGTSTATFRCWKSNCRSNARNCSANSLAWSRNRSV